MKEDLVDFNGYATNPNVGPPAGWKPHESMEESYAVLLNLMKTQGEFALVFKETSKVIGSIGIYQDKKRFNQSTYVIGYSIAESYWGQGLTFEAMTKIIPYGFDHLHASLLTIYHFPENEQSKSVIKQCGFQYEGTLRLFYVSYDGQFKDSCAYSMTREEYRQLYLVSLKEVEPVHLKTMYRWEQNETLRYLSGIDMVRSWDAFVASYDAYFNHEKPHLKMYSIAYFNRVVGRLELFRDDHVYVGIIIDPNFQGQGFGTLVLKKLLQTYVGDLYAEIYQDNQISIHLFEKLGFIYLSQKVEMSPNGKRILMTYKYTNMM